MAPKHPHRRWFRSPWLWWPIGTILTLVILTPIVFSVSPWPGALLIRSVFTSNAQKLVEVMQPFAPTSGVDSVLDVAYAPGSEFTTMDVYYPTGTTTPLGTVVWTHGGAWISGDKANDRSYFQILASHGYTVIGLNYTYGPEAVYPTAVNEINGALAFILANAATYHVDTNRIVMAGDSAGAQLTSQIAALTTNPEYAAREKFTPALQPGQLRGLVLNCGVYDMRPMIGEASSDTSGATSATSTLLVDLLTWGNNTSLWAYTGDRNLGSSPAVEAMSSIDFVTAAYPPVYITGGNADPLTAGQTVPMIARLTALGTSVDSLLWPADYTPPLPHEYQFHLDTAAAQTALTRTLAFLDAHLAG